jgi:hypothetical protein
MSFGTNAPEGFVENVSKISATCNTQDYQYDIASGYATSLFTGDPVTPLNNGFIGRATNGAGNPVLGVFKGVTFMSTTNELMFFPYWVANTVTFNAAPAQAFVIDDPYIVFTIQAGSSDGGTQPQVTRAHINKNADYNFGAGGSTFSGKSGAYLDVFTVATTIDLPLRILSITPGFTAEISLPPQNILSQNYNNANVLFNNHKFKGGTGTVGT